MLQKVLVTAAMTASALGATATPAMAVGGGQDTVNANGAKSGYGNAATGGKASPQMTAIEGTLNKPCLGIGKLGLQSVIGILINLGIQDVPIATSQQMQQCTDNSVINDGDDQLSHIADGIALIAGNGFGNE
ncbi:RdlA protein [Streptomyces sp. AV19]|uniref:rodlin n=1 Tax=Streptomyces sp. AV19 TaxID=2793068 RepID=UPI0018FE727E|nr:rodlin [Streptomyces sp. AV19]MBH1938713.1 RdlA protein [Streptomyces sp. AV19]MDG4533974.1 rodlin [Streptomyces sp. AV19]